MPVNMLPSNANLPVVETTEEPYPGLNLLWYTGRQIVEYRVTTVSESALQKWAELVVVTLEAWDKSRPYLAIHDLSSSGVALLYSSLVNFDILNIGIMPDMRAKAEAVFDPHDSFKARVAVNFNISFSGRMGKFLTSTFVESHPSISYRTFYNHDKSLHWLLGTKTRSTDELNAV